MNKAHNVMSFVAWRKELRALKSESSTEYWFLVFVICVVVFMVGQAFMRNLSDVTAPMSALLALLPVAVLIVIAVHTWWRGCKRIIELEAAIEAATARSYDK